MMRTAKTKQDGISLFIILIVVLLTGLVVAMGFKSIQFYEIATGNTAEYQRTYEAAQALIHDAELDIMGLTATGSQCAGQNCRTYGSAIKDAETGEDGNIYFPMSDDLTEIVMELYFSDTGCIAGVCRPLLDATNAPYAFWEDDSVIDELKAHAAHYGRFTGSAPGAKSNPRLAQASAWYWVELLPYDISSSILGGTELGPTDMAAFYRITALVEGNRNTTSVIQKIVVGKKVSSS